jgi:hypothetical protein
MTIRRFPPPWTVVEENAAFYPEGSRRPVPRLCVFRGGARPASGDKIDDARRGAADCSQHRQLPELLGEPEEKDLSFSSGFHLYAKRIEDGADSAVFGASQQSGDWAPPSSAAMALMRRSGKSNPTYFGI